jgi:hypothetical protein
MMKVRIGVVVNYALWLLLWPSVAAAQNSAVVRSGGVSAIWILANIAYAGMRAQNNPSTGWRIIAFIFGFPGSVLTWLAVREGSERAYGIDLPRRR